MSLDYNLTAVKDFKKRCIAEDGDLTPDTRNLIFATLAVGMPKITTKTAKKFAARLNVWEHVLGSPTTSLEKVIEYAGLSTNADTLTTTQFRKKVMAYLYEQLPEALRKDI